MTNDYGVEIQCEPQLCTIPLEEYESLKKRIAELKSQLENVQASMYAENVDANMALIKANERIKELENKNKNLQYSSDMWMACCKLMSEGKRNVMSSDAIAEMNRIKELEAENKRLKEQVASAKNLIDAANEHLEQYKNKLATRTTPKAVSDTIVELREENARLKAQVPKWHSVNCFDDDLPTRSDMFCVLFHTAEGKLSRSACYYFADEDGDSRFGEWEFDGVEKWCELPLPPPPTEESSETEKDG